MGGMVTEERRSDQPSVGTGSVVDSTTRVAVASRLGVIPCDNEIVRRSIRARQYNPVGLAGHRETRLEQRHDVAISRAHG